MITCKNYDVIMQPKEHYNYESPISKIYGDIRNEIIRQDEENFMCTIEQMIGYKVDKDELIKALQYDRDQYNKGYKDGVKEALEKNGRKFEEIVVQYPPAELCTYPEHRGKPYFSIKYEENGKHIIGFGTYKPEVLSRYLLEYFITTPTKESEVEENG